MTAWSGDNAQAGSVRVGSPVMAKVGVRRRFAPYPSTHPMSVGYVYILTNAAMPGYIKIGLTRQEEMSDRLRQLDNTSTPLPFECYFAAKVPDCRKLERTLHFVFGEKRARQNREFFTADPDVVKAVIELVAIKEEPLSDAEQAITPEQRGAIEATKRATSERMSLERLGMKLGTSLLSPRIRALPAKCQVQGPCSSADNSSASLARLCR